MNRVIQLALVLAAALAAASCDKVPLLAPTGSTVTLSANATTIPTGGTVGLTAFVTESNGSAVQNGTTVRFNTTMGSVTPASAQTTNGIAVATFNAGDQSGVATVTAVSGGATGSGGTGGSGGTSATATNVVKITIGAAAASKVTVAANPASVSPNGGSSTITATVLDTNGGALPGVPVTFTSDQGVVAPTTVTTDTNGQARATLTSSVQTVVTATVGAQSATVTVSARSGPGVTISCTVASGTGTSCASVQANANTNNATLTFTVSKGSGTSSLSNATINFGDGSSQSLGNLSGGSVTVSHVYSGPSSGSGVAGYTPTVTAVDVNGESTTASTTVTVTARGTYAVDLAVSPGDGTHPLTESFTATVTNGDAVRYEWNFGDGSDVVTTSSNKTSHFYSSAGNYTATVTATASDGRTGTGRVEFNLK